MPTFLDTIETIRYGENLEDHYGIIAPQTERVASSYDGDTSSPHFQNRADVWGIKVAAWAYHIDPIADHNNLGQIDMPDSERMIRLNQELARSVAFLFSGGMKFQDEDHIGLTASLTGALDDFIADDEWYIGRSQMSQLLEETVIAPSLAVIRYVTASRAEL